MARPQPFGRALLVSAAVATILPSCQLHQLPAFCGATDAARAAVANAGPSTYPAVAAQQVPAVRKAAAELSGDKGSLANRVAADLEAASKLPAKSLEFTDGFNRFVDDSNQFDHLYCNLYTPPD